MSYRFHSLRLSRERVEEEVEKAEEGESEMAGGRARERGGGGNLRAGAAKVGSSEVERERHFFLQ